jgi:hypothetical protein
MRTASLPTLLMLEGFLFFALFLYSMAALLFSNILSLFCGTSCSFLLACSLTLLDILGAIRLANSRWYGLVQFSPFARTLLAWNDWPELAARNPDYFKNWVQLMDPGISILFLAVVSISMAAIGIPAMNHLEILGERKET